MRVFCSAVAAMTAMVFTASMASAQSGAAPTVVSMATATRGGGFTLFGDAAAAAINAADPTLRVETKNTKGSLENIGLLADGKFDIALVQGVAAHEAYAGIGRKPVDLKVIAAIYSSPGMFVVRGGSPARTVADLKGLPIAWGTKNSGLTLMARYIMDGLGLDRDKDFKPRFLAKAGDGPGLVASGEVAAFWGGGIGWPGFTRVMKSGGRFIGFTPEDVEKVTAKHAFLKAMTVPAGSYQGQKTDVLAIGVWSFIIARKDLPDDTAYRLARALHKANPALAARLRQAKETLPENTAKAATPSQIHPGVRKYLKEIGAMR
ncbi:MAG: TAXI family TRAP transporter solute-binding subunit [Hyphomicrobiaceae bacterium]|nr:TAXI family TRAP transporter solute-binding subunit [Hyphomicrobiaceae bacterium]